MFTQTWKKYLPVILLLMKRSANGEQFLNLNFTDFQRAAGGKKIKFTFYDLHLTNGRINYQVKHTVVAKDLSLLLQENELARPLIRDHSFEFSLNSDFRLSIKNTTPVLEMETQATA
jgi:hypothetical protein